jgi:hypothetical protein
MSQVNPTGATGMSDFSGDAEVRRVQLLLHLIRSPGSARRGHDRRDVPTS